jgi:hypothetical protein
MRIVAVEAAHIAPRKPNDTCQMVWVIQHRERRYIKNRFSGVFDIFVPAILNALTAALFGKFYALFMLAFFT